MLNKNILRKLRRVLRYRKRAIRSFLPLNVPEIPLECMYFGAAREKQTKRNFRDDMIEKIS